MNAIAGQLNAANMPTMPRGALDCQGRFAGDVDRQQNLDRLVSRETKAF